MNENLTHIDGIHDSQERIFETYAQAEEFYLIVLQRILNVGGWNALTGSPSGKYKLLNYHGEIKVGSVEEGDFISIANFIDQKTGDRFLLVERKISKLHDHMRSMALMTRPVELKKNGNTVSYTVRDGITYTILIQLRENIVTVAVYEKNQEGTARLDETFYEKVIHKLKDVFSNHTKDKDWNKLLVSLIK